MKRINSSKIVCKLALVTAMSLGVNNAHAHWIYISNEKDDTISVIDSETNEVIKTIEVGERPRGVTLSKDFKYLFICASDSDTVQMMDLATDKIIHDLPMKMMP